MTIIEQEKLEAHWISGFVDGDGTLSVLYTKDCRKVVSKRHRFIVSQDKSSKEVLYALKEYFKCGTVQKQGKNMMCYQVGDRESLLKVIIPFFFKHPLLTKKKRKDFYKFAGSMLGKPCVEDKISDNSINGGWFAQQTIEDGLQVF